MRRHVFVFYFLLLIPGILSAQTWEQARVDKKAQLNVNWFNTVPFIYQDENGDLAGIEYELTLLFKDYLSSEYNVSVELNWTQFDDFGLLIDSVKDSPRPNYLAASAFSITESRKKFLDFTDPYLPDLTVLVTGQGTPIAQTPNELRELLINKEAVSVQAASYETLLYDLRKELDLAFPIVNIESDASLLEFIREDSARFGFIDFPIYLLLVKEGSELVRQDLFTAKGPGYSFILPKGSDWATPFNAFYQDPKIKKKISIIISKYLGDDIYDFLQELNQKDQINLSLSAKERELQLETIREANRKIQKEEAATKILGYGIIIFMIFFIAFGVLFMNNRKTTQLLKKQHRQIERQQQDIESKNDQLIDRNAKLMTINDEKSNLVQILAHDLRSPLNQIIGLADVLKILRPDAGEEELGFIAQISDSAKRLSGLVSKILNAESFDEGQEIIQIEDVDVVDIFDDISDRYEVIAKEKGIKLVIEMGEQQSMIETDHLLLLLVLENLISNALKFSPFNTEVKLVFERKENEVLFQVIDQGPGFSDEDKKLMFGRFQKLSARPTGGETSTGLGLSIVKRYITDLGGKVWIESEEGKGTTFFISLCCE
ncbi:MAG: ATP-binding protein [Bacteroidota bacterium]